MSLTAQLDRDRIDILTVLGGFAIVADTIFGLIASLGLDLSKGNQLGFAIINLLGVPLYLLDVSLNTRLAISLLGLWLLRWGWMCLSGSTPVLLNPVDGNPLLIIALVLLQASKLRQSPPSAK